VRTIKRGCGSDLPAQGDVHGGDREPAHLPNLCEELYEYTGARRVSFAISVIVVGREVEVEPLAAT
jgi:hypothetical protein